MIGAHDNLAGDHISINGSTGDIYEGQVATKEAELSGDFSEVMALADKYARMKVRTNADTLNDAMVARRFGAKGIGLCPSTRRSAWPGNCGPAPVTGDDDRAFFLDAVGLARIRAAC